MSQAELKLLFPFSPLIKNFTSDDFRSALEYLSMRLLCSIHEFVHRRAGMTTQEADEFSRCISNELAQSTILIGCAVLRFPSLRLAPRSLYRLFALFLHFDEPDLDHLDACLVDWDPDMDSLVGTNVRTSWWMLGQCPRQFPLEDLLGSWKDLPGYQPPLHTREIDDDASFLMPSRLSALETQIQLFLECVDAELEAQDRETMRISDLSASVEESWLPHEIEGGPNADLGEGISPIMDISSPSTDLLPRILAYNVERVRNSLNWACRVQLSDDQQTLVSSCVRLEVEEMLRVVAIAHASSGLPCNPDLYEAIAKLVFSSNITYNMVFDGSLRLALGHPRHALQPPWVPSVLNCKMPEGMRLDFLGARRIVVTWYPASEWSYAMRRLHRNKLHYRWNVINKVITAMDDDLLARRERIDTLTAVATEISTLLRSKEN
ncbi:hypothetical protein CC2G_015217 [Coprinopsis cinerea AmutBmut pab1-1]|nr:hypothetical protein CC2G_015217 [Coprinopsis cinerea AmutBmut pab1-1]